MKDGRGEFPDNLGFFFQGLKRKKKYQESEIRWKIRLLSDILLQARLEEGRMKMDL
jgi:hypothetical protein